MPIMAALEKLNDLIDESDPDVDMPNIVHAFQTAEEIRAKHPDQDWFHLTGLIHDLGEFQPHRGIDAACLFPKTRVLVGLETALTNP